jgi:hypothetical protein
MCETSTNSNLTGLSKMRAEQLSTRTMLKYALLYIQFSSASVKIITQMYDFYAFHVFFYTN